MCSFHLISCFWTSWIIIGPDDWLWFGRFLILRSTLHLNIDRYGNFLKWGLPLNHPFIDRFSIINHPIEDILHLWKPSYHHLCSYQERFLGFPKFVNVCGLLKSSETPSFVVNLITTSTTEPWNNADSKENYPKKKPSFSKLLLFSQIKFGFFILDCLKHTVFRSIPSIDHCHWGWWISHLQLKAKVSIPRRISESPGVANSLALAVLGKLDATFGLNVSLKSDASVTVWEIHYTWGFFWEYVFFLLEVSQLQVSARSSELHKAVSSNFFWVGL